MSKIEYFMVLVQWETNKILWDSIYDISPALKRKKNILYKYIKKIGKLHINIWVEEINFYYIFLHYIFLKNMYDFNIYKHAVTWKKVFKKGYADK